MKPLVDQAYKQDKIFKIKLKQSRMLSTLLLWMRTSSPPRTWKQITFSSNNLLSGLLSLSTLLSRGNLAQAVFSGIILAILFRLKSQASSLLKSQVSSLLKMCYSNHSPTRIKLNSNFNPSQTTPVVNGISLAHQILPKDRLYSKTTISLLSPNLDKTLLQAFKISACTRLAKPHLDCKLKDFQYSSNSFL